MNLPTPRPFFGRKVISYSPFAFKLEEKRISINFLPHYTGSQSAVGIATRYGMDGLGIESPHGARFSSPVQTGPEAHPVSCTMGIRSNPGVNRPGCGIDHPPPSSAEVKEKIELYLCSPSGPLWQFVGWTLPLYDVTANETIMFILSSWALHSSLITPADITVPSCNGLPNVKCKFPFGIFFRSVRVKGQKHGTRV